MTTAAVHLLFTPTPGVPWYRAPDLAIPLAVAALAILGLLAVILSRLPSNLRARKTPTLDPVQLEDLMLGDPPQIVDLRSPQEFNDKRGHIRGAINIPFPSLPARLRELDPRGGRPVVLVDANDVLSHRAAQLLHAQGFKWFYVLKGGYHAWCMEVMPTYGGVEPPKS